MLKRIAIDNYKCLVNFSLDLDSLRLFLGGNGSGKSTVFEALRKLRALISGEIKLDQAFGFSERCRWQDVYLQSFGLDIENPQDQALYTYRLVVEHSHGGDKVRIREENLFRNGQPLFSFESGSIQLYRDNSAIGPAYPFDWTQSGLATITPQKDNQYLTWFKRQIQAMVIIQIVPPLMENETNERGSGIPSDHFENFVSWYRNLSQEQGLVVKLTQSLKEVLDGFDSFRFEPYGARYLLQARFLYEGLKQPLSFEFNELSDGQRTLIALYALLEVARETPMILCLDEPENFISLPEIQPWVNAMRELCEEDRAQLILTTHHPEMIDLLYRQAYWFERPNGLAVRVHALPQPAEGDLRVSELIARRWIGDE